jgi:hypothetical protein
VKRTISLVGVGLLLAVSGLSFPTAAAESAAKKVTFRRHQLDDKFRSEGVAVGDFNRDGNLDIAAGFVWYSTPDCKMHVIASKPPGDPGQLLGSPPYFDPKGYSNSFANWAEDLNGDGWTDLIVVDFPGKQTWWFENPQAADKPWTAHVVTPVTNNESPQYADIDGDGKRELIAAFSPDPAKPGGPDRQMAIIRRTSDPNAEWTRQAISTKASPGTQRYAHGLGVGDVNKDQRLDIVCAEGWWEAPASGQQSGEWKFHRADFGGKASDIVVYDFDGDGDQDVLTSSPHAFGVWWHENQGESWKTHEIDMTFSQNHAVCLADINGDGLPDFVTGKRWWAHAAGDPGVNDPAVFNWFELQRAGGKASWVRHQFDHNSGPGTQFQVIDVNGDGLLDIVTSNKKGVHYFHQIRE